MVFGAREDIYDFDVDVRTHFLDHLGGGLDGLLHLLITELGSGSMNSIEGLVHHLDASLSGVAPESPPWLCDAVQPSGAAL